MTKTIEVLYEAGVLRPVEPIKGIREHERLTVTISSRAGHPLAEVVGTMPDEDAREMMDIIEDEFGKVDPNEWK